MSIGIIWNTKIGLGKFQTCFGARVVRHVILAAVINHVTMESSCASGSDTKGSIMENVVDTITDAVDTLTDSVSHVERRLFPASL